MVVQRVTQLYEIPGRAQCVIRVALKPKGAGQDAHWNNAVVVAKEANMRAIECWTTGNGTLGIFARFGMMTFKMECDGKHPIRYWKGRRIDYPFQNGVAANRYCVGAGNIGSPQMKNVQTVK